MDSENKIKAYFWGYDIFGYLLPGAILALVAAKTNDWVYEQVIGHWHSSEATFSIYFIDFLVLILFVYILGHIISGLSSLLLEKGILRRGLKYPTNRMFQNGEQPKVSKFKDVIFPGYFRAYSEKFQEGFYKKFESKFPGIERDPHDLFWISFSHISQHHPVAYKRATHFLELYGFSRNISMSFLLIAFLPVIPQWNDELMTGWILSLISVIIAIIMFINYTKLIRRLNDEVFRAFYVST